MSTFNDLKENLKCYCEALYMNCENIISSNFRECYPIQWGQGMCENYLHE